MISDIVKSTINPKSNVDHKSVSAGWIWILQIRAAGRRRSPITISRQLGAEHRKAILPAMTVVLIYIEIHGAAIKCWGIYPPPVGALLHIAYKHFS